MRTNHLGYIQATMTNSFNLELWNEFESSGENLACHPKISGNFAIVEEV